MCFMKGVLFCPKSKPFLNVDFVKDRFDSAGEWAVYTTNKMEECSNVVNGFAVAECEFDIEGIDYNFYDYIDWFYSTKSLVSDELYAKSCMKEEEMENYLKPKMLMFSQDNIGYAIHIKNIRIFQNPRELSDYTIKIDKTYDDIICDSCTAFDVDCKQCHNYYDYEQVMKAPRNMMKVCEWNVEDEFLMSVKPEEMARLLKGEQSIIIRKRVSKELM